LYFVKYHSPFEAADLTTLTFTARPGVLLTGEVVYRRHDQSIDFEPAERAALEMRRGGQGSASLLMGTLQLEFGVESRQILFPWGFCPESSWSTGTIGSVTAQAGELFLSADVALQSGVSRGLREERWEEPVFDVKSGWLSIGKELPVFAPTYIEFASDCIAALVNSEVVSLRLEPRFV
jgi:hypothetical protein